MTAEPVRIVHAESMSADHAREVRRLVDQAETSDGFSALNEAALLALDSTIAGPADSTADPASALAARSHRSAYAGDRLIGYGQRLGETGSLVVAPDQRRRGVGRELLHGLIADPGPRLSLWATRDTKAARGLAEAIGLVAQRELLIMNRSLVDEVSIVEPPAGIRLRSFAPGSDEDAWLRVNARAFADHPEQGAITRADLDQRMAQDWFDPAGFLVATKGAELIGFHWTKQQLDHRGEVYVLGVDPSYVGRGLGKALLTHGLAHLRSRGNREVILYTEGDNAPAVALYQRHGFTVWARDVMYGQPVVHTGSSRS